MMLDDALAGVGPQRLLWGCDVTMETGLAKLRALDIIGVTAEGMTDIRWRNAARIFPKGTFPVLPAPWGEKVVAKSSPARARA